MVSLHMRIYIYIHEQNLIYVYDAMNTQIHVVRNISM